MKNSTSPFAGMFLKTVLLLFLNCQKSDGSFIELSPETLIWLQRTCRPSGVSIITRPILCIFLNFKSTATQSPLILPSHPYLDEESTKKPKVSTFNGFFYQPPDTVTKVGPLVHQSLSTKIPERKSTLATTTQSTFPTMETTSPSTTMESVTPTKEGSTSTRMSLATELPPLADSILESLLNGPVLLSAQELFVCAPSRETMFCYPGGSCPLTYDFRRRTVLPGRVCSMGEKCRGFFICGLGRMDCPHPNKCIPLKQNLF